LAVAVLILTLGSSDAEARALGTVKAKTTIELGFSSVSGEVTVWNNGRTDATIHDVSGSLEVRFKRNADPPESIQTEPGSSPNWFKIADIPLDHPFVVPAKSTVAIPYSSTVCPVALAAAGVSFMRTVVEIEASEGGRDGTVAASASLRMPDEIIDFC
jgi:hypothetical protein